MKVGLIPKGERADEMWEKRKLLRSLLGGDITCRSKGLLQRTVEDG